MKEPIKIICANNADAEKIKKLRCLCNGSPMVTCDGDCKFCYYSVSNSVIVVEDENIEDIFPKAPNLTMVTEYFGHIEVEN